MSETKQAPGANEIASYLRRHPEFLHEYPDLALTLLLPRDEGASRSLASYQLDVLRDKNREMTARLHELIGNAQDNERLMLRVHGLCVALLRERTLDASVRRVLAALTEDFHTELVRLVLFRKPSADLPAAGWLIFAANGAAELPAFAEFLAHGEPLCGRLHQDKLDALFGARAGEVQSTALVPVGDIGMLAIGSADANRFHPGIGTVFLKLIADAIAAAVMRFDQA